MSSGRGATRKSGARKRLDTHTRGFERSQAAAMALGDRLRRKRDD
jgi:hypothetical protein